MSRENVSENSPSSKSNSTAVSTINEFTYTDRRMHEYTLLSLFMWNVDVQLSILWDMQFNLELEQMKVDL